MKLCYNFVDSNSQIRMLGLEKLGLLGLFIGTFLSATVIPFSSDALYIAILAATKNATGCLIYGTLGNWIGSVVTYWIGWLGRWEWVEKWFRVNRDTILKQKARIDRYGSWLALLAWVPFFGDLIALALGFFRTRPGWVTIFLLIGKFIRFVIWTLVMGYI